MGFLLTIALLGDPVPEGHQDGQHWIAEHIEPAIREELMDPESARFEWPFFFSAQSNGWATCGYVNSKNSMGGYVGKNGCDRRPQ